FLSRPICSGIHGPLLGSKTTNWLYQSSLGYSRMRVFRPPAISICTSLPTISEKPWPAEKEKMHEPGTCSYSSVVRRKTASSPCMSHRDVGRRYLAGTQHQ